MSEHEKGKSSINWGGLCKGLLAGAAIVVGVEMVCPGTVSGILGSMKDMGSGIGKLFTSGGGAPTGEVAKEAGNWMTSGIGWLVTKVAGAVAVVMGANYLLSDKKESHETQRAQQHHEARESFALREDMRKMQAVMVARMQASGHEPAMAQQGR